MKKEKLKHDILMTDIKIKECVKELSATPTNKFNKNYHWLLLAVIATLEEQKKEYQRKLEEA